MMLGACTQKSPEETVEAGMPDFVPTADDTTQVTNLVQSFLSNLVAGDTEQAVSMLRDRESINPYTLEPDSLDAVQLAAVTTTLSSLDIKDASIESIDFGQFSDYTTVTCNVTAGAGYNTKLVLKPIKAKFIWCLALPVQ